MHHCGWHDWRIFRTKHSRFISELFSEKYLSVSTWRMLSVLLACALGWNNALVTLFYMFVVMSNNLIEQKVGLNYSVLHLRVIRMLMASPIGHLRPLHVCVAPSYGRTSTCWHTHFGKLVDWNNFCRKRKVLNLIASKIICVLQSITPLSCAILNSVMSRVSEQIGHLVIGLSFVPECNSCPTREMMSTLLRCVCLDETLHWLFCVTCLLSRMRMCLNKILVWNILSRLRGFTDVVVFCNWSPWTCVYW